MKNGEEISYLPGVLTKERSTAMIKATFVKSFYKNAVVAQLVEHALGKDVLLEKNNETKGNKTKIEDCTKPHNTTRNGQVSREKLA